MNASLGSTLVLDHLGTIAASGVDARTFLQGQLSADLRELSPTQALLATCNSSQGRVQAIITLIERSDGIALLLPSALIDATLARLKKYVLRAKVTLRSGSDLWRVQGYYPPANEVSPPGLTAIRACIETDGVSHVRWPGEPLRVLQIVPVGQPVTASTSPSGAWRLADIRAGLSQVYPETHEAFVAQMVNVDALGGISFTKGCYTGQEIIARAHYRGRVKRRMFRFAANIAPPLPGTHVLSGTEHVGDVVDAAATDTGCELLAVVSLARAVESLSLADDAATALTPLPLPYVVGEPEG